MENANKYINEYKDAISDFSKVLELDPNNEKAYYNRAIAKIGLEDYIGAISDFTKEIEINRISFNFVTHFKLNDSIYEPFEFENYSEIEFDFYQIDPTKVDEYVKIICDYVRDYTLAIELNPNYIPGYYIRAYRHCELNNFKEAIEDYSKIIELNAGDIIAYYNRALANIGSKSYDDAISDFSKIIKLNPDIPITYSNRALAKTLIGDTKGAISDYTKYIE